MYVSLWRVVYVSVQKKKKNQRISGSNISFSYILKPKLLCLPGHILCDYMVTVFRIELNHGEREIKYKKSKSEFSVNNNNYIYTGHRFNET